MTTPPRGPRYAAPVSWAFQHVAAQVAVLGVAGVGLLLTTWDAPVYQAVFGHLPAVGAGPLVVGPEWWAPLLAPLALGLPLALTRYRAPLLLWITLMAALAVLAVVETSRLNWYAFSRGIAYRLESGPVPLVRTSGGVLLLLSGLVLLAQQSVRLSVLDLAARGVPAASLAAARDSLLRLERTLAAATLAAGLVLTAIVAVSLRATEGAPQEGTGLGGPLVWTALLVTALLAALGLALSPRRRRAGRGGP